MSASHRTDRQRGRYRQRMPRFLRDDFETVEQKLRRAAKQERARLSLENQIRWHSEADISEGAGNACDGGSYRYHGPQLPVEPITETLGELAISYIQIDQAIQLQRRNRRPHPWGGL